MKRFWSILLVIGLVAGCSAPQPAELRPSIVGGKDAKPHEFPFMMRVQISIGENAGFSCGGSLLSETWVVTAAHCLEDAIGLKVVAGEHDFSKDEDEQIVDVKNVITRDEYVDDDAPDYDIALLELETPLKLNKRVQPIPYASELIAARSPVTVAGWGERAGGSSSDILQKVSFLLDADEDCVIDDFEAAFCIVDDDEKRIKLGDSGGPLFVEDKLLGVLSFRLSIGGASTTYYASLPFFADWIEKETGVAPDGESGGESGGEGAADLEPNSLSEKR